MPYTIYGWNKGKLDKVYGRLMELKRVNFDLSYEPLPNHYWMYYMKNLVLNLLFASLCGLSFAAYADDQKASMAEKAVDSTVKNMTENVAEKTKEVVSETTDASAKSPSSEEKAATNSAADNSAKTDEKPVESTADTSAAESAKTEEQPAAGTKEKKDDKEPDCD